MVQDGGYFPGNNIARHILETGSQEYYDAFETYIREPGRHGGPCRAEPRRRHRAGSCCRSCSTRRSC